MIPLPTNIENARDDYEREIDEAQQGADDEGAYFEYEWFGLTHSYSKEGYWLRIVIVLLFFPIVLGGLFMIGEWGIGLLMTCLFVGGVGLSVLSLVRYQRNR